MARDLLRERAPGIDAVLGVVVANEPDAIALHGIDWDAGLVAAQGVQLRLARLGWDMPHLVAPRPNSGMATGLDLDGDGTVGEARDAQGYGRFAGAGGTIVLSRYPIVAVEDLSDRIWREFPWAELPVHRDGSVFPSDAAQAVQRLSSTVHVAVTLDAPEGPVTVLTHHATPPVFDGPEDRNGLRNRDELRLWRYWTERVEAPYVLAAVTNLDPEKGDGLSAAWDEMAGAFIPVPVGNTAVFDRVGPLQVSQVLPARGCPVADSGIVWPERPKGLGDRPFTRHALVFVDVVLDGCPQRGAGISDLTVWEERIQF